jgi:hypothetical protein
MNGAIGWKLSYILHSTSKPAMGFLNPSLTNKRFKGSTSHIRLHAWDDGYCKTADEPSGLRVFYLRKSNDLHVMKVMEQLVRLANCCGFNITVTPYKADLRHELSQEEL